MTWTENLMSWMPFLVLIGIWFFLWRQGKRPNSPAQRSLAEQKRHNDALEKILTSHEARLQKIEEDKRS
jgi:ATP-dependent Zn protease